MLNLHLCFFLCNEIIRIIFSIKQRQKENLIKLGNIDFWASDYTHLEIIDEGILQERAIQITFEDQKDGDKMERKHQESTGEHVLCPVRAGASVHRNLLQMPGITIDTPILSFTKTGSCVESLGWICWRSSSQQQHTLERKIFFSRRYI